MKKFMTFLVVAILGAIIGSIFPTLLESRLLNGAVIGGLISIILVYRDVIKEVLLCVFFDKWIPEELMGTLAVAGGWFSWPTMIRGVEAHTSVHIHWSFAYILIPLICLIGVTFLLNRWAMLGDKLDRLNGAPTNCLNYYDDSDDDNRNLADILLGIIFAGPIGILVSMIIVPSLLARVYFLKHIRKAPAILL